MQEFEQIADAIQPASSRGGTKGATSVPGEKQTSGFPIGKLLFVAALCVAIGLISFAVAKARRSSSNTGPPAGGRAGPPPAVPVVAGTASRKDVPIYLEGLGTVQAFNTVTIRPRVDGQIQRIAFIEGQDVHAGDLLAKIDPDPLEAQVAQAEARKGQDEAQLTNARLDLKRDADLLNQHIVSQQIYDTQKALVDQFEATVRADQAAIDNARVQLQYTTILSPIDGRTGIRLVDQGNVVRANDANGLVVVTQLRPISVVFTLPEQTLHQIQTAMSAGPLTVAAVARDNSTVVGEGQLTVVDNQIDSSTGTIKLKATFPNTDLRLWPGQFVNARLLLSVRKGGTVVPASVVQRGPDGPFAFVIKDDLTVQVRPLKVAQMVRGEALLDGGLSPGERVVVDGQYKLQPGSKVKPARSAKEEDEEDAP
jgi:multidrug efflux system membrane fusion protein